MVPILSGIIAGEGDNVSPSRGFTLAFSYVMGMALVYTGAGVASRLAAGLQLQATFNQPWVLILFSALFVFLSFGMFGAFELQMPSSIQSRLCRHQQQSEKRHGHWRIYYGCAVFSDCNCLCSSGPGRGTCCNGTNR